MYSIMQFRKRSSLITHYSWLVVVLLPLILVQSGCSLVMRPMMAPVALSIQRQTDIHLVRDGAPALLLVMDGLVTSHPENRGFLQEATRAYGAYALVLDSCAEPEPAVRASEKAKQYGLALLNRLPAIQRRSPQSVADYRAAAANIERTDLETLFWGAFGWAVWIEHQEGSPAAMADLPKVEQLMNRVTELDGSYYHGAAHVFLGAYYGARPVIVGGNPETSRSHFEQALLLGKRQLLTTQVLYAETYARMALDRDLFATLLNEVLATPADVLPDNTLGNQIAKKRARELLDQIDEYF